MNVALRTPQMTREQFLDWVEAQEAPYEFDGFAPVAMTGGNINHALMCSNLVFALRKRLTGTIFAVLPEAGVATVGSAVRYPDVLVAALQGRGTDRLVAAPLIVFELLSPSSGRIDRHVKLREYAAVTSIRRYVIVDHAGPDVSVLSRSVGQVAWTVESRTAGEALELPELGIEIAVDEVFEGLSFD